MWSVEGLPLAVKAGRVMAEKGEPYTYIKSYETQTQITVIKAFNAYTDYSSTMFVLRLKG